MLERYKALLAMRACEGEPFTIKELASASGVKEGTVRTILNRESLVEPCGTVRTGNRGGQPTKFHVPSEREPELHALLRAIDDVAASRQPPTAESSAMTSLLAGEEMLLELTPESDDDEREAAIEIATVGLEEGMQFATVAGTDSRPAVMTHIYAVHALLELTRLETAADLEDVERRLAALKRQLAELRHLLEPLDERLWRKVGARVDGSPVAKRFEPASAVLVQVGADSESFAESLVSRLREAKVAVQRLAFERAGELSLSPGICVLVLGSVANPSAVLREFAEDMPGHLILVDAAGSHPQLGREARDKSIVYLSREEATDGLSGALRVMLAPPIWDMPLSRSGSPAHADFRKGIGTKSVVATRTLALRQQTLS